jgi:hypothetical protein
LVTGAEVEMLDAGGGGTEEVVLRNRHVVVRISPRRGGRLVALSPAGSPAGTAPPATAVLLDVGHDTDRWEVVAARPNAGGVEAVLGHVRGGCPLIGSLKIYRLGAADLYVAVDYRLAPLEEPFTVRCDLPPGTWAQVPDGEPLVWEPETGPPHRLATSAQRSFTVHLGVGEPPTIDLTTQPEAEATLPTRS